MSTVRAAVPVATPSRRRSARDPAAAERGRLRRTLLLTCLYGLLGVLLLSMFATLVLALTGHLPLRRSSDVLRTGGIGLAALGLVLHVVLDHVGGSKDGRMFIRFTMTGWRLGAPVWVVGLAALAAGSLLAPT